MLTPDTPSRRPAAEVGARPPDRAPTGCAEICRNPVVLCPVFGATLNGTNLSATPTIEAVDLRQSYRSRQGDVHALDGLDLVAPAGSVTALLGPNGAGKTTFVKAVATHRRGLRDRVRAPVLSAVMATRASIVT